MIHIITVIFSHNANLARCAVILLQIVMVSPRTHHKYTSLNNRQQETGYSTKTSSDRLMDLCVLRDAYHAMRIPCVFGDFYASGA